MTSIPDQIRILDREYKDLLVWGNKKVPPEVSKRRWEIRDDLIDLYGQVYEIVFERSHKGLSVEEYKDLP